MSDTWKNTPIGINITCGFSGDDWPALFGWIDAVQPAAVLVNNHAETVAALAARYPLMTVYYRIHERADGQATDDNQHVYETGGQTVARMLQKRSDYGLTARNIVYCFNNEPPGNDLDSMAMIIDHAVGCYRAAADAGIRVCGPHFGIAQPSVHIDTLWADDLMPRLINAAAYNGASIGLHPYSPGKSEEQWVGDWHITAAYWTEVMARIIGVNPAVRLVLSEIGSEYSANIPTSNTWRKLYDTGADYARSLVWLWDTVFSKHAANIDGAMVFAWGERTGGKWHDYNIRTVPEFRDVLASWRPATAPVPQPTPEPEPIPVPTPAPEPIDDVINTIAYAKLMERHCHAMRAHYQDEADCWRELWQALERSA